MNEYNQFTDWRTPESERQKKSEASIQNAIDEHEIRILVYDYIFGRRKHVGIQKAVKVTINAIRNLK